MKQYTKGDWEIIKSNISAAEKSAGYLSDNIENLKFSDLRERLAFLHNLLTLANLAFSDKATDCTTCTTTND